MYRSIGHTSTVDESLFGKSSGRALSRGKRTVTGPLAPSTVVLTAEELARIKVGENEQITTIFVLNETFLLFRMHR